jgi:hypothetical protein
MFFCAHNGATERVLAAESTHLERRSGTGRKKLPSIYVKRAAERHKDRSDAERRNEGFPSW